MSDNLSDLIKSAWKNGDPTAWFEQVYARAAAGEGGIPWAYNAPNPYLMEWLEREQIQGAGQRALVVGCGLGDDAQALAERGFAVTAFDVSETAIAQAKARFPNSPVDYQVADLFKTPESWRGQFNFVLEIRTIQALPWQLAEPAIATIASFVAPGGTLLVLCAGREPHEERRGIPWPLSREELALFHTHGLAEQRFEEYTERGGRQFRVTYRREVKSE